MPFEWRILLLGLAAVVVMFLILVDVSEVEEEMVKTRLKAVPSPVPGSRADSISAFSSPPFSRNSFTSPASGWIFNRTLSSIIRKKVLRFLDAERDISILKSTFKPGDIIHYVFDRQSTTNISENLYRLLPTVSPMKNQHYERCAIVGNSGILLNSSCGPEIDSHDFVIRCNLAPVEEYAEDVGLRSSLVTMNPSVVQRAFQDLSSKEWRQRFVRRLQALSGSVLWIPAFMAKSGEDRVEWAVHLILSHTVNVHAAFPSLRLLHAVRGYVCVWEGEIVCSPLYLQGHALSRLIRALAIFTCSFNSTNTSNRLQALSTGQRAALHADYPLSVAVCLEFNI